MDEKHQNRKKDKYNPYTLIILDGRYYLSFKDSRGALQSIEIDEVLPEVQRRRLLLYFFGEMTYEQFAAIEGCTKRAVKFSVDIAIEKLKKDFGTF